MAVVIGEFEIVPDAQPAAPAGPPAAPPPPADPPPVDLVAVLRLYAERAARLRAD